MLEQIKDIGQLLPEERDEIRQIYTQWQTARANKDWAKADRMRSYFYLWDTSLGDDGVWYPIFEHPLNRQRRAFIRMQRYGVDVYPWKLV